MLLLARSGDGGSSVCAGNSVSDYTLAMNVRTGWHCEET
jgi:hypothetical protein